MISYNFGLVNVTLGSMITKNKFSKQNMESYKQVIESSKQIMLRLEFIKYN